MAAAIELPYTVDRGSVERAHRWAMERARAGGTEKHHGIRAAKARDPKLLLALEKAAEVMDKASEEQMGRTRRDPGTSFAQRREHTETQMWREAYRLAADGNPNDVYGWIYAAAARLAGLIP